MASAASVFGNMASLQRCCGPIRQKSLIVLLLWLGWVGCSRVRVRIRNMVGFSFGDQSWHRISWRRVKFHVRNQMCRHSQIRRKRLGTRRSCLVLADTADTTVVSAVSATTRHDRFFLTKDVAPFSIHIPTKKPSFTPINDFVVDS